MSTPPSDKPDAEDDSSAHVDDETSRVRKGLEQFLPDVVKRAVQAGVGAVFSSDEGIRHLPKEVANFLFQQAANSKDEVMRVVAGEVRAFLEKVNLNQEMQKLLTSLSLEIKTEIHFIPNDEAVGGIKREVKNDVSIKRIKKDE